MNIQIFFEKLLATITPVIALVFATALLIVLFFVFSYVFLALIILTLLFAAIGFARAKFQQTDDKPKEHHQGRIIDQTNDKNP